MPETESFISTKSSPLLVNIGLVERKVHEDVSARPSKLIRNEFLNSAKKRM
jgi:hypothetical protein